MDGIMRNFFDQFHQILGFETQAARDEAVAKIETVLTARATERFLKLLASEERRRYEEFLETNPGVLPKEVVEFLRSLRPALNLEELVQNEAQQFAKEYVAHMLRGATAEQKTKIASALKDLVGLNLSPGTS